MNLNVNVNEEPPHEAVCTEDRCMLPAVTLRPGTEPWITDDGVIFHADEWVCSIHTHPEAHEPRNH